MSGPEASIERAVAKRALLEHGIQSVKFNPFGETGIPDRWFLLPGGRPFIIEFKQPGQPLTAKQTYWVGVLTRLGYDVEVHDRVEDAVLAIQTRLLRRQATRARRSTDR